MAPSRASNTWDPVLLISQILAMQTLHYLTLSIILPPFLAVFAETESLIYEGGAANVGMIMDWRQMAGKPTARDGQAWSWAGGSGAWSGGQQLGSNRTSLFDEGTKWNTDGFELDPARGWVIAFCWMLASVADIYYLYALVRRPRLILDFSLTLIFNHLVLTSYYAASFPTSIFFWLVMIASAALMIIMAEQLCVRREMNEGLSVVTGSVQEHDGAAESMEMGSLLRRD